MGYSKTLSIGDAFAFGGAPFANVTITNVAADVGISSVSYFDAVARPIQYAYLDLYVGAILDTSGAANYLEALANLNVDDGAGHHETAMTLEAGSFYTNASQLRSGVIFHGSQNIAAFLNAHSPWVNVILEGADAHGNGLRLKDVCPVLRVSVL